MNFLRSFRRPSPLIRRAITVMLSVVALTVLRACTPVTTPPPEEGVTDVAIQNLAFTPKEVTIKVGERVRWTNLESGPISHTSTSGSPGAADGLWDSDTLSPGDPFTSEPFEEVGEFVYFCEIHQSTAAMRDAKVIVVEP